MKCYNYVQCSIPSSGNRDFSSGVVERRSKIWIVGVHAMNVHINS